MSVCIALSDYVHERCVADMDGFKNVSVKNLPWLQSEKEDESSSSWKVSFPA